jgi:hypothetical protein
MQYALPHPSTSIAIPLVTLLVGAAGGATVAAIVSDDEIVRLPAQVQTAQPQVPSSYNERPQEGVAAQATNSGPQVQSLSERTTDHSAQTSAQSSLGERPEEGAAVRSIGSGQAPGLSEKSSDPSLQPSPENSLGSRP